MTNLAVAYRLRLLPGCGVWRAWNGLEEASARDPDGVPGGGVRGRHPRLRPDGRRGHDEPCASCSEGYVSVKKSTEKHAFCVVNGKQVDCTKTPSECPACAKAKK
jgi:hypothetical protein